MKKFIFKLFIATFSIYLPWISFISYGKSYYTPTDYLGWDYKHQLIKDKDFNPRDIVIGDSLAMTAINPKLIDDHLYNLAQSGSTPVDAYYYLKKYLSAGKSPRKVYLSFGTTHWQSSDVFREQSIAYDFMNYSEFTEFLNLTDSLPLFYEPQEIINIFKDWFPFNSFYDSFVSHFRKQVAKFDYFMIKIGLAPMLLNHIKVELVNIIDPIEIEKRREILKVMKENNGQHLFDQAENVKVVNPTVEFNSWSIHPINKLYFEKILNLLKNKNIEVVLDFVPNNPTSWVVYKKEFFDEMEKFFKSYQSGNGPLKFNSLESFTIEKMGDMDHVNELGMIEYSKSFKMRHYSIIK